MLISKVKSALTEYLETTYDIKNSEFQVLSSKSLDDGDFYTNLALKYSKIIGKSPMVLAQEISEFINTSDFKLDITAEAKTPGFINFYYSDKYLLQSLQTINSNDQFGKPIHSPYNFKTIIVEYSSPNIAKPFTIGHLRTTIVGDFVANILEFANHKVVRDNHIGDWGTQFGKLTYAIAHFGDISAIESSQNPIKDLVDLYILFHSKAEEDPSLEGKGREYFKRLEDGDPKIKELWEKCIKWSMKEFERVYKLLNVSFDISMF